MNYPEVFILRHGQTEWNLAGRMQGRLDSPLTEKGQAQARDQGLILQALGLEPDQLSCYCSPQGRAIATARIALGGLGCTATRDPDLCEVDLGTWSRCRMDELHRYCTPERWQELGQAWYCHIAPEGESYEQHRARCQRLLDRLDRPTILVTHGITSNVLRGLILGLSYRKTMHLPGGQGCLYRLRGGKMWHCTVENPQGSLIEGL